MELDHECEEVDVKRVQPSPKFDHIKAPQPALDLAYSRLVAAEPTGQIGLAQPFAFSAGPQQLQKRFVVPGVQRLEHVVPSPAR